jgi:hypothetical protein
MAAHCKSCIVNEVVLPSVQRLCDSPLMTVHVTCMLDHAALVRGRIPSLHFLLLGADQNTQCRARTCPTTCTTPTTKACVLVESKVYSWKLSMDSFHFQEGAPRGRILDTHLWLSARF